MCRRPVLLPPLQLPFLFYFFTAHLGFLKRKIFFLKTSFCSTSGQWLVVKGISLATRSSTQYSSVHCIHVSRCKFQEACYEKRGTTHESCPEQVHGNAIRKPQVSVKYVREFGKVLIGYEHSQLEGVSNGSAGLCNWVT